MQPAERELSGLPMANFTMLLRTDAASLSPAARLGSAATGSCLALFTAVSSWPRSPWRFSSAATSFRM